MEPTLTAGVGTLVQWLKLPAWKVGSPGPVKPVCRLKPHSFFPLTADFSLQFTNHLGNSLLTISHTYRKIIKNDVHHLPEKTIVVHRDRRGGGGCVAIVFWNIADLPFYINFHARDVLML